MYTLKKILYIIVKNTSKKNKQMLLTQEPTFVILMVVTQEPTTKIYISKKRKRKIASTHAFQNHGMIYCYIPWSCKASATSQKF